MSKEFSGAPQFVKYFAPLLDALQQLGGSGRVDEVRSVIAQRLNLSEEEQSEQLPSKTQARFDNQVHWARFYLTKVGLLGSSQRGVWTLTKKGQAALPLSDVQAKQLFRNISSTFAKSKRGKVAEPVGHDEEPITEESSLVGQN
ncbi:MAG TPA: winged helix-turn-helix domain-containing protein [Pyrinomonadaceae bacterium]|jgi:restriction system protein|nr:winged helix-turn-helix domain-containing protein [Pyrinomonadaceae bacterium]